MAAGTSRCIFWTLIPFYSLLAIQHAYLKIVCLSTPAMALCTHKRVHTSQETNLGRRMYTRITALVPMQDPGTLQRYLVRWPENAMCHGILTDTYSLEQRLMTQNDEHIACAEADHAAHCCRLSEEQSARLWILMPHRLCWCTTTVSTSGTAHAQSGPSSPYHICADGMGLQLAWDVPQCPRSHQADQDAW